MGLIGQLLSFTRVVKGSIKLSDVKLDPDGGSNITGEHYADPGDDAFPLPADYVAAMAVRRNGGSVAIGYADTVNDPKAAEGEKRIYGRDPTTGLSVNEVWLKADGSIIMSNSLGAIELKADGSVDINGAIISAAGEVTNAVGKVLGTHVHAINSGSSAPGPTAPPT